MSAEQFIQIAKGKSAKAAFKAAVEQAEYDHGHSGYTGTIAEKEDFISIPLPKKGLKNLQERAVREAERLFQTEDERIDDKWGPAGCIKADKNTYVFFGWAST